MKKLLLIALTSIAYAGTFNFQQLEPEDVNSSYKTTLNKEIMTLKNDMQDINININMPFKDRIEILEKLKEHNLIGEVEANSKEIHYSGIFGDIKVQDVDELVEKIKEGKQELIKNWKKIDNYSVTFADNALKYKEHLQDEQLITIANKIVGEKGDLIIFEANLKENNLFVMAIDKHKKLSIMPLEKLI